jgi:hypothetical protein
LSFEVLAACYGETNTKNLKRETYVNTWSIVVVVELRAIKLKEKFTAFYGIYKFITVFTTACNFSISCQTGPLHSFLSQLLKIHLISTDSCVF